MPLPSAFIIILGVIAFVILVSAFYIAFKGKPEPLKVEVDEETEGLVFDQVTGKYVTVEELIQHHRLNVIDEEKIKAVYEALPPVMREEITQKEVAAILETHYQFKVFENEEEKPEEEYILAMLKDGFERKGKNIDLATIARVVYVFESFSSPA
jgi:hypothetical protein